MPHPRNFIWSSVEPDYRPPKSIFAKVITAITSPVVSFFKRVNSFLRRLFRKSNPKQKPIDHQPTHKGLGATDPKIMRATQDTTVNRGDNLRITRTANTVTLGATDEHPLKP